MPAGGARRAELLHEKHTRVQRGGRTEARSPVSCPIRAARMLPIVRARSASLAARADMSFIIRSPLLDPKQRVLGYKLAWQPAGAGRAQAANVATLAAWVMPRSRDTAAAWLAGENQLFLQASPAGLRPDQLEGLV